VTCGVWVGFDSRQSLGEKETGAKAALPVWMAFMKAAIEGKPDEQFPGADENAEMLKTSLSTPAKPGSGKVAPTPIARAAKPVTSARGVQAATHPVVTPVNSPAHVASKPPLKVAAAEERPAVRPALPQVATPVRPSGAVKPALNGHRP